MTRARVRQAASYFQNGDVAAAVADCEAALRENPGDAHAWMILGGARHRFGHLPEALDAFDRALNLHDAAAQAWSAKAAVLADMGRLADAESTLTDAMTACPGEPTLQANLANVLELLGKTDEALQHYTRALDVQPEEKALFLARNPQRLAALKKKLATNIGRTSLFDTESRVRQLEAAYTEMWRRHEAGLPPESFDVVIQPPTSHWRGPWH